MVLSKLKMMDVVWIGGIFFFSLMLYEFVAGVYTKLSLQQQAIAVSIMGGCVGFLWWWRRQRKR